jgi:SHS2 domain-containing protein
VSASSEADLISVPCFMRSYTEIDHTADRAFRVRGRDLAELFTNAALALAAVQAAIGKVAGAAREVEVAGIDREALLVNWLNEILYLQEQYRQAYSRFEVLSISEQQLRARLHGVPYVTARTLIKAVTFHGLELRHSHRGWEATVVIDIYVPENGLISLNVPLDRLRVGAWSTRTTHPFYMARWHEILDGLGIAARLQNPYRFKTKGEMLAECKNQNIVRKNAIDTISCSSARRRNGSAQRLATAVSACRA